MEYIYLFTYFIIYCMDDEANNDEGENVEWHLYTPGRRHYANVAQLELFPYKERGSWHLLPYMEIIQAVRQPRSVSCHLGRATLTRTSPKYVRWENMRKVPLT
jgi:hypothetical protein